MKPPDKPKLTLFPKVASDLVPTAGPPEFVDVEQRSDEWLEVRRGIPTASRFADVLAGGEGLTRRKYLKALCGELWTGEIAEGWLDPAMVRGIAMEFAARDWYGRDRLVKLTSVGFVRRQLPSGRYTGGSPDALVDDDGVLEIKTMRPDLMSDLIVGGVSSFPSQHRAQCQGLLWLTGRAWCDLVIFYSGRLRPLALVYRVNRDERFIKELANAIEVFDFDLNQLFKEWQTNQGAVR